MDVRKPLVLPCTCLIEHSDKLGFEVFKQLSDCGAAELPWNVPNKQHVVSLHPLRRSMVTLL